MTMQRLCQCRATTRHRVLLGIAFAGLLALPAHSDPPVHNYPTQARVEYVNECIAKYGGKLSNLYQCSCTIDQIANRLSYDDFVEASTYSKYAGLPGEGGAIFRDSDQAKKLAKLYRELETEAHRVCGLGS